MKILFFTNFTYNSVRISNVQFELIYDHIIKGDRIKCVLLDDSIKEIAKLGDPIASNFRMDITLNKFRKEIKKLGSKLEVINYDSKKNNIKKIPSFESIEDLKNYTYKGINIGMGVASTLISVFRDHKIDISSKKKYVDSIIIEAIRVADTIINSCTNFKPDLVYVLNGRGATTSPVVRYCIRNKIPYKTFELVSNIDEYDLIDNAIPHDIGFRNNQINRLWNNTEVSQDKKKHIAQLFFDSNRKGISTVGINFTDLQKEDKGLEIIGNKEVITFFNSSIDEFASVPGWEDYIFLYKDEVDAITQICEYFRYDDNKLFVLRIHPNLKGLNNAQTQSLKKLDSIENLIIFQAGDSISTYQLIDDSSKVITFGSTVGIEATYFGKPSISLGLSIYMYQDVVYIPKSKEELYGLIEVEFLEPKPRVNTYPYAYWIQNFGISFKYRGNHFPKNIFDLKGVNKIIYWGMFFSSKDFLSKLKSSKFRKKLLKRLLEKI